MKRIFMCSALMLLTIPLHAQVKLEGQTKDDFWYKLFTKEASEIGLVQMSDIKSDFHWRLWFNGGVVGSIIDISVEDEANLFGTVSLYTREYVNLDKEEPTDRIFSKSLKLSAEQSANIYKLIKDKILALPTDSLVKGWSHGFDGVTYAMETVRDKKYSLKTYWTPKAQEIAEARTIQSAIDSIGAIINRKQLITDFTNIIPFESYYADGGTVASKIVSNQQRRKYKKERQEYRKTAKFKNDSTWVDKHNKKAP